MTISGKNIKTSNKKRNKRENITLTELKAMLPVFISGDIILVLAGIIYCFVSGSFDYRLFTGILAGNFASVGYFLSLGIGAENALLRKNNKKARFSANLSYGMRYVGLFLIYALLMVFGLVNIFTAVIPLFFPRIYYFLTLFKKK